MVTSIDNITNLTDAKAFLSNANNNNIILSVSELEQIILKMDAKVSGSSVTLMYTGEFDSNTK